MEKINALTGITEQIDPGATFIIEGYNFPMFPSHQRRIKGWDENLHRREDNKAGQHVEKDHEERNRLDTVDECFFIYFVKVAKG